MFVPLLPNGTQHRYRIDFGCGDYRHPGCTVGVDIRPCEGLTHLAQQPPLPFPDGSCDFIFTNHTLEHLTREELGAWMREFARLLQPGGVLEIHVPHFSCGSSAWGSPDHVRPFGVHSFDAFDASRWRKGVYPQWGDGRWRVREAQLLYRVEYRGHLIYYPPWGQITRIVAPILNFLARLQPDLCERLWAVWVGGFAEVKVVMEREGKEEVWTAEELEEAEREAKELVSIFTAEK